MDINVKTATGSDSMPDDIDGDGDTPGRGCIA